ncbi:MULTISPECIES: hypothetical protein [Spirosoma]|uniref:Uncharacterized protein n=1 Tax=Spirosoma liriopis TaxID=2937440 RepID=A0ABT0HM70_9BACT|nr:MULTISPECIES: hypothetical protein [Spirosoma]MCK8492743.1 hypothetical protein [Spirosoma liriopis]UHG92209.1 hypothetical protein LQ777_04710 [Spirosoma oryzicola]
MGKLQRHVILHRFLCLLMALHVINVSIDAPDPYAHPRYPGERREDLSINEIESFGELLLEECFGFENAIPEHEESDDDSEVTNVEHDYFFHQLFVFTTLPARYWYLIRQSVPFKPAHVPSHVPEITSPPPQYAV